MSLQLSYEIKPPAAFDASAAPGPTTAMLSYALDANAHLPSLEVALGTLRDEMNDVLSAWKNAVGPLEAAPKQSRQTEEGEEDGEE